MKKNPIFVLEIDKETIRSKSMTIISKIMKELERDPIQNAQKVVMGFAYDDVPEEIFQIDEVREWVKLLFATYPHFLFYASTHADTDQSLIFCLCAEISVVFKGEYISQDEYVRKYGKLDKIRTTIQLNGIGPLLEKYMNEIDEYSIRMGIRLKGQEIIADLLDRWRKKLIPAN